MKTLGNHLKAERIKRGLTQSAMAELLGVTRSAYSLYESGRREPNVITLKNISDALGISLDDLLDESEINTKLNDVIRKQDSAFDKLISGNVTCGEAKKIAKELRDLFSQENFLDNELDRRANQEYATIFCYDNNQKTLKAFDDFLTANQIKYKACMLNGVSGKLFAFGQDSAYEFFLTDEQSRQLPEMSIEQIKALIRSFNSQNKRD